MSNEVFLIMLQIIIQLNVMVNRGANRWRLTFEFDDFDLVKASTKKIAKESQNRNKNIL